MTLKSLSSCGGQGLIASESARSPPWRAMRAGTSKRSWLYLLKSGETPGHRRGSGLRLERRQTRSSNDRASARLRDREGLRRVAAGGPIGLRAACEFGKNGFWRKEFWFAYIQSVGLQGAHGPAVQDGIARLAGLAAAARRLHARVHTDA